MAPFSFSKPISEQGYVFEKPEAKRFAERMVRVSGESYGWDDFWDLPKSSRSLWINTAQKTKIFTPEYSKLWTG